MVGKVTSRGQITIPLEIRNHLGIEPGSVVEFEVQGDAVLFRKLGNGTGRGDALVSRMRGTAISCLTTDEIMRLTRA